MGGALDCVISIHAALSNAISHKHHSQDIKVESYKCNRQGEHWESYLKLHLSQKAGDFSPGDFHIFIWGGSVSEHAYFKVRI